MKREDFGLASHEPDADVSAVKVKTVKEMDKDERPRERAINFGIGSLTTPELLAIILRTGQQGFPITELCRQLMEDNNRSLLRLQQRSRQELMLTPGIGPAKALQIEAMMELMRRYQEEMTRQATNNIPQIKSSKDIYERMRIRIANIDHEEIWVMLLNNNNIVISEFRVTSGNAVSSIFDVRMIIKRALLENAMALVMCHNHPSGNLYSSPQDDLITRKLRDACKAMDIRMLDHVIISTRGYYSYADQGRI